MYIYIYTVYILYICMSMYVHIYTILYIYAQVILETWIVDGRNLQGTGANGSYFSRGEECRGGHHPAGGAWSVGSGEITEDHCFSPFFSCLSLFFRNFNAHLSMPEVYCWRDSDSLGTLRSRNWPKRLTSPGQGRRGFQQRGYGERDEGGYRTAIATEWPSAVLFGFLSSLR